jgi:hypothetical protein
MTAIGEGRVFSIRIFEKGKSRRKVSIWLYDDGGTPIRELEDPIGHLPRAIDWPRTIDTCRSLGDEGLQIDFVFQDTGARPGNRGSAPWSRPAS